MESETYTDAGQVVALEGHADPNGWIGLYRMPPGYLATPAFTFYIFANQTNQQEIQQIGYLALEWQSGIDVSAMWIRSQTNVASIENLDSPSAVPIQQWGGRGQLNYAPGLDENRSWALLFFAKSVKPVDFHIGLLPGGDYEQHATDEETVVAAAGELGWRSGAWEKEGLGATALSARAELVDPATACSVGAPTGEVTWTGNLSLNWKTGASGCGWSISSIIGAPSGKIAFLHWNAATISSETQLKATLHGKLNEGRYLSLPAGAGTIHEGEPTHVLETHYLASKGVGSLQLEVNQGFYADWSASVLFDVHYVSINQSLEEWIGQPMNECFVRGNPVYLGSVEPMSEINGYCTGTYTNPR